MNMLANGNSLKQPKIYTPPLERKKKKFPGIILIIFLIIILTLAVWYLLFYLGIFKIKNIIIENSPNSAVSSYFDAYKGKNILGVSTSKIEGEISREYPEITNLRIMRGLPDTLKIKFNEKGGKIIWQTLGKSYLVDGEGRIYKESLENIDLVAVKDNKDLAVTMGQVVASKNFMDFVIEISSGLKNINEFKIVNFEINETIFQVDVLTDQNLKIVFDTTRKAPDQLADLSKFLENHSGEAKEYIDLRIEGRVFFK